MLGAANEWILSEADLAPAVRAGLRLAVSNALATNNRLCSYATDYGRLSALFSVRGYSLPWLPIELNPLHGSAGRGTLLQCVKRVARSCDQTVRRHVWNSSSSAIEAIALELPPRPEGVDLQCASAADACVRGSVDLLVFDPPYFDFIEYDELAEVYRAWQSGYHLVGQTLQSAAHDAQGSFGASLASCLVPALDARVPGRPIVFTYHSAKTAAWEAVGVALDEAKLRVTAAWPVRSDGHMGHHSHPGNCEWDVVIVARPVDETDPAEPPAEAARLLDLCGGLDVGGADAINLNLATEIVQARWSKLRFTRDRRVD